ncbi:flavin reductase family protein [Streptomyces sp. NPDC048639]|uniref:flavin reductase family protein n=1 Tax=Streptomyces sp. NPDC048639 TaxID=3365581 RepID=UPI00371E5120
MTVDGTVLRTVLRSYASGVAVLTAATPTGPAGVTITSFTSISADPALVSFALADSSSTWARLQGSLWFGLHILGADQTETAERFAGRGVDRFAPPTRWSTGPHGVPLLDGCLARLVGFRYGQVRLGDHHLVICSVEHAETGAPGDSLVHLHGALLPAGSPSPARI